MKKIFSIFLIFSLILNINIITFADAQATTTTEKGWVQSSKGWIYYTGQGNYYYKNTLTSIDGVQYYFDSNGIMAANKYTKYNSTLYYSDGNGSTKAFTGWKEEQTSARIPVYYLYYTGKLQSNKWSNYNGNFPSTSYSTSNCYYVGSDGKMITNKNMLIGNDSYSFDSSGKATKTTSTVSKDVVNSVAGNLNSVQTYFKNNILKGITSKTAIGDCIIDGKYYSGSGYDTAYKIGAKSALKKILEQKGFKIKSITDLSEKHWSNERVLNDMIYEYSFTVILEENKDSKNSSTNQNSSQTTNNINQSNQVFTTLSGGTWGSNSSGHSTYTGANNGWYLITNSKNYPDWDNYYYWFNNGEWWVNGYQIYTRTPNVNDENNWLIWKNGKESKWKNNTSSNTNTQPQTNTITNNNVINQPSNNSQPQQIQIEGQNTQSHDFANSIKQSDNTTNIIDTSKLSSAGSNAAQMLMQAAGITSDFANSTGNIANTNDDTASDISTGGSSNSTKLVEMSEIDELFDDEGKFNGEMLQSNGTATVTQQPKTPNGGGSWDNWANNEWDYYSINKKTTDTKGVWIKYGNSYYYATEASEILTYSTEKKDNQKVSGQYVVQTLIDEGIYCIDKKLYKFDDTGKMIIDDQTDTNGALKGNKGTITLKADGKLDKGHEIVLDESELTWTIHENDTKNGPCFKNSKFIIEYEDSKNYTYLYEDGYAILKTNDSYALYKIISGKASKVSSAGNTVSKIKTYLDKGSYKESTETAEVKDNKTTTPTSTTNTSNTNNTTTNNTNNTTTTSSKTTANIDNNYVSNGKFYNSKDSKTYTVNSDGIITNIEDGNKGSTTGNYEVVDYGGTSFLKKV